MASPEAARLTPTTTAAATMRRDLRDRRGGTGGSIGGGTSVGAAGSVGADASVGVGASIVALHHAMPGAHAVRLSRWPTRDAPRCLVQVDECRDATATEGKVKSGRGPVEDRGRQVLDLCLVLVG
jgi:hypothetical protein